MVPLDFKPDPKIHWGRLVDEKYEILLQKLLQPSIRSVKLSHNSSSHFDLPQAIAKSCPDLTYFEATAISHEIHGISRMVELLVSATKLSLSSSTYILSTRALAETHTPKWYRQKSRRGGRHCCPPSPSYQSSSTSAHRVAVCSNNPDLRCLATTLDSDLTPVRCLQEMAIRCGLLEEVKLHGCLELEDVDEADTPEPMFPRLQVCKVREVSTVQEGFGLEDVARCMTGICLCLSARFAILGCGGLRSRRTSGGRRSFLSAGERWVKKGRMMEPSL